MIITKAHKGTEEMYLVTLNPVMAIILYHFTQSGYWTNCS